AFTNYTEFANLYNFTYSKPMPGMVNTNVNGTDCKTMTPQGICFAKDYMLVSAYDSSGTCNSIIYVISNTDLKNRKFLTSLVLPIKTHVGGIAFDGSSVWVSNGKKASSISYTSLNSKVKSAVSAGKQSISISFSTTCSILTESSFMTYYNNMLWIGEFKEKDKGEGKMYAYTISSTKKTLTKKYLMTVPDRTQGVCFKDGYLIASRSYCRSLTATQYISQFRVYKPSFSSPSSTGQIYKNTAVKVITLPPMAEGIVAGSTYVYTVYESAATKYATGSDGNGKCLYPVDRIVASKFADIINTNPVTTEPATEAPTTAPTEAPTEAPTTAPTEAVTDPVTEAPTEAPTAAPTEAPTQAPTEAPTEAPTQAVTYFKACSSSQTTIAAALSSIGVDNSFAYRKKIAAANNITNYSGTAAQNTQMLNLLKQGKLIKP
ncbi:MAG: hypothetical protein ACI4RP_08700, partial [Acutalibacteraceae bacterium]